MTKLIDNGVEILTKLRVIDTTDNGVTAIDRGQNAVNVDGDKVVLAVGLISQATLYQQLEGKVPEMYLIGDCVEPQRVGEATRESYKIGSIL